MKAVVLVGGRGTRLRPLTFAVPKPLLAVGETPILQGILTGLRAAGVTEAILATGYLASLVEAFCGDGARFGLRVSYVHEEAPLGTAGPLAALAGRVGRDEPVLLMNGDIVTDARLAELVAFARRGRYELTVAWVDRVLRSPYGVLDVRGDEVVGIVEKPSIPQRISAGIYVVTGAAIERVPARTFFTVPDLVERLRAEGRPVGAWRLDGAWTGVEELGHLERLAGRADAADDGPGR